MKTSLPYSLSIYKYLCFAHFVSFLRSQLSSSVIHLILLNFILCAVGQSINKYIQNIQDVVQLSLMIRYQHYSLNTVYMIIFSNGKHLRISTYEWGDKCASNHTWAAMLIVVANKHTIE